MKMPNVSILTGAASADPWLELSLIVMFVGVSASSSDDARTDASLAEFPTMRR